LVYSTEHKQTINTKGKECASNVGSHFFGGALLDIPENGCGGDLSLIHYAFFATIEMKLKKSITINKNRYSQLF